MKTLDCQISLERILVSVLVVDFGDRIVDFALVLC
jgi:hypothetical protein